MADETLRVAVVGAGYFAQFHHHAWTRLSRTELVAVCDLDGLKAKSAADQAGARGFSDLGEMLDAVAPDLVDIATPPETHDALVRQVAARGLVTRHGGADPRVEVGFAALLDGSAAPARAPLVERSLDEVLAAWERTATEP